MSLFCISKFSYYCVTVWFQFKTIRFILQIEELISFNKHICSIGDEPWLENQRKRALMFICVVLNLSNYSSVSQANSFGQVNSPELPEMLEITEMMENFTKVTKYLTKFKETLIDYVWEKSHVKKQ